MNIDLSVLATVTALGVDASIVNKSILVKGLTQPIPYATLKPSSIIAPVTEVLQVTTGTPTAANSTYYAIVLTYRNKVTKSYESKIFSMTSDASGTATEICDNLRNQINSVNSTVPIVATGTTTLILTGEAGYNQVTATNIGVGVIAFVTGTPAVIRVGYGADLLEVFPEGTGEITPTAYYYQAIMDYGSADYGAQTMSNSTVVNRAAVLALSTATNIDTLVGTYGTLTQALAGYAATYVAGTGTLAADDSDDLLTLATGTFPAQNIEPGDVLFQDGETTYYVVNSVITVATALSNVAADNAAAAYTIIHRTKII
jgi:hypothetical protein